MRRGWMVVITALAVAGACTSTSADDATATSAAPTSASVPESTSGATTTVRGATTTVREATTTMTAAPPPTYPLGVTVAFLDQCVERPGAASACHCALAGLAESGVVIADVEAMLDATDSLPGAAEGVIGGCVDADILWLPSAAVEAARTACSLGDERLLDACECAVERAKEIVPADRLEDFITADVRPSLVDLLNRCLAG